MYNTTGPRVYPGQVRPVQQGFNKLRCEPLHITFAVLLHTYKELHNLLVWTLYYTS